MSNIDYKNPFVGSKIKVSKFFLEDDIEINSIRVKVPLEDENERFDLFSDGTLIRKTISEEKYFQK